MPRIIKAYTRQYRDNGQRTAYVEWDDGSRTEGAIGACRCCGAPRKDGLGDHMAALFDRARREGIEIGREVW